MRGFVLKLVFFIVKMDSFHPLPYTTQPRDRLHSMQKPFSFITQAKATLSEPADRQVKGQGCGQRRGKRKGWERDREPIADSARLSRVVCPLSNPSG